MRPKSENDAYVRIRSRHNRDYYCPARRVSGSVVTDNQRTDECVEVGVVQRYAGNIDKSDSGAPEPERRSALRFAGHRQ